MDFSKESTIPKVNNEENSKAVINKENIVSAALVTSTKEELKDAIPKELIIAKESMILKENCQLKESIIGNDQNDLLKIKSCSETSKVVKDSVDQLPLNTDSINKTPCENFVQKKLFMSKEPVIPTPIKEKSLIKTELKEQISNVENSKNTNFVNDVNSLTSTVKSQISNATKTEIITNSSTEAKQVIKIPVECPVKETLGVEKISSLESKSPTPKSAPLNSNNQLSDRIENLSSEISLGFGEVLGDLEDRSQTLIIREGPLPYKTILQTVCAYAIRCPHDRIAIQKLKDHNGFWLPFVYANESEKYADTVNDLYEFFVNEAKNEEQNDDKRQTDSSSNLQIPVNEIDSKLNNARVNGKIEPVKFLTNVQLFNIYRFQIPDGQFISRYLFLAQWGPFDSTKCKITCCKNTNNLQWYSMDLILQEFKQSNNQQIIDRIWGFEVVMCATVLQQQQIGKFNNFKPPQIQEFTSAEVLKYISRYSSQIISRSSSSDLFCHLLQEAKFSEKDVIKIYCDYVQHCYPSTNMTYCSFYEYFINKIGFLQFDEATLRHIFRAMNYKNKNFIVFSEFLFGLAALDASSPNSQLRCTYIFRYYDRNSDGYLDEEDFRRMITDIRDKANLSCDQNEVRKDVNNKLSNLKLLNDKKRINYDSFLKVALNGHLGGTIHLFRTNKPILETIHIRHAYEYITNKSGRPFGPRLIGTCPKCKPKKYSLSYHTVKLNSQGRIDDPKALVNLSCGELDAELQFKKKANEMELKHSIEIVFNESSTANKVLAIIRKMQDFNKLPRDRQKEISQAVINLLNVDLICQLCKEVTEIFTIESRVLKVNTPCLVIGDLHGNINDLLTYEEQLWPLAPTANAPNVLFLGDYVDRGDYSIEVISYLFAMKILAPTKFFLLRGNHEIRAIQKNFTFARECVMKYFYQNGQKVFEAFNNAFDNLPLVGIIDESIFCAHGGIPYSVSKIEELYKIPMPMSDPEYQSKAAWEILWSDPITDEEYTQVCQFKNQSTENGFTDNLRRSTAYYFTEKALRNFLKANSLSHVIRAHELEAEGYRFHHSGLLITVFSSSRYCNSQNKSAAVFVDGRENDGFIKVIALDT